MKLLLFCLLGTLVASSARAQLSAAERETAKTYLQETKERLLKTVNGLGPAQLAYKPAPDRWSIAECLEHIAVFETGFVRMHQAALRTAPDTTRPNRAQLSDAELIRQMTDRSQKNQSPEMGRPTGRFPDVEAVRKAFGDRRDQTIRYLSTTPDDLRSHFWHHPTYGTMDLYQMLLLIGAHGERHRQQIEEVKASPGFPR